MDIRKFFQAPPAKAPRTDPETPIEPPSCSSPIIPSTCEPKIDPLDIGNEKYAFTTAAWMPNISKKIAFHQRDENKRYYLHHRYFDYSSDTVQNQLLEAGKSIILRRIKKEMIEAEYFSVISDETMDVSRSEQLCTAVRYVYGNSIRERFLTFTALEGHSAVHIKSAIISSLTEHLDLKQCKLVGQSYDGASVMSGDTGGVQRLIRNEYPAAFYLHCSAHAFNLSISKAAAVLDIKVCMGTINNVANFFRESAKRSALRIGLDGITILSNEVKEWLNGQGSGRFEAIVQDAEKLRNSLPEEAAKETLIKKETLQTKIYEPFLKAFRRHLKIYFDHHFKLMADFTKLLPGNLGTFQEVRGLFRFYIHHEIVLADMRDFEREFDTWRTIWQMRGDVVTSPTELAKICSESFCDNLAKIFQILATLGFSATTAERSFSVLKYIKDILRNSMAQNRLNNLCSLYIHTDISVEEIIDEFARNNHRLKFA
ncbi:52 kDa repressor of the inhibitor of the protein kinase [Ditylenchus destructor]|uniref:52 kDa repressor of the inhibitor of the protein kinase n=1 Tax=Ditylenchus destructor TaxID=166010 RepID=A0AAD4N1F3_9BILA|nr:52 kDa repressor of the inhibitor of the protein kinase [Ditylenchus destructor]